MVGKCFICGIEKIIVYLSFVFLSYSIDKDGQGWTNHIEKEHNLWNYNYIYYLKNKKVAE